MFDPDAWLEARAAKRRDARARLAALDDAKSRLSQSLHGATAAERLKGVALPLNQGFDQLLEESGQTAASLQAAELDLSRLTTQAGQARSQIGEINAQQDQRSTMERQLGQLRQALAERREWQFMFLAIVLCSALVCAAAWYFLGSGY